MARLDLRNESSEGSIKVGMATPPKASTVPERFFALFPSIFMTQLITLPSFVNQYTSTQSGPITVSLTVPLEEPTTSCQGELTKWRFLHDSLKK